MHLKDLTGERFGRLIVVERAATYKNRTMWLCKCDCGNKKVTYSTHLLRKNIRSCGCLMQEHQHTTPPNWNGYGEISGSFFAQIKSKINSRRPSRQSHEFNVTIQFLWELFLKQNRRCALTGRELVMPTRWKKNGKGTASLDRIDNTKGYTEDNVQWIHKDINRMKNIFNQDYFIETCRSISEYCSYHYGV